MTAEEFIKAEYNIPNGIVTIDELKLAMIEFA